MKIEAFKQHIKDVNEQFHVVQTAGTTEVHWVYGGFDVYEKSSRKPQYQENNKGIKRRFKKFFDEEEANNQPLYHVIAEISEENEHVVSLNLDASRIPENMRRLVLPVVSEYVQTRLDDREEKRNDSTPIVKTGEEIRQERRAKKQETEAVKGTLIEPPKTNPEKGDQ